MPIYPLGLDKTNFPRILNPRGAKGVNIPTTRTRSRTWPLTSGWATLGPLYNTHGPVPELCLTLPWCTAGGGTQHRSPVPIYPLELDKTNIPRILNSRGETGAKIPTTRTRSRTWTLTSGRATRGPELRLTTWRPPSLVLYPGFLDKTNIPRILNSRGETGAKIPTTRTRSRTWTLTSGRATRGPELRLTTWRPPSLVLYPGFLDKTNFPRILTRRARYPQDPSTIPTRSRPWTLPGSPMMYRCWGHPARVSCAHLSAGAR